MRSENAAASNLLPDEQPSSDKIPEAMTLPDPVRTLVVDDDEIVREMMATTLQREGYTVFSAASSEAALALLARQDFDIVLADIFLPGEDGFKLLARIRAQSSEMPIILISGMVNSAMAKRALQFKQERGRLPSLISPDPWEKKMAEGIAFLTRMKAEKASG